MRYGNSSGKNFEKKILIKKINDKQRSPTRTRIQTRRFMIFGQNLFLTGHKYRPTRLMVC